MRSGFKDTMRASGRGALVVFLAAFGFALSGCSKSDKKQIEPCSLLTKEEIETVQGSPIKDITTDTRGDENLHVSQCYYAAEQSNRSVSFSVTQSRSKKVLRQSWEKMFGTFREEKKEPENPNERPGRGEKEEEAPVLKKIEMGDEAFWTSSPVGGVLYVLRGNIYLRISVGGPDSEDVKIDKSKSLMEKALKRL